MKTSKRQEMQLSFDLRDVSLPGVVVEVDAAEAELMGAFIETAIDEDTAMEANLDGDEVGDV
jgi:hypothetical protein